MYLKTQKSTVFCFKCNVPFEFLQEGNCSEQVINCQNEDCKQQICAVCKGQTHETGEICSEETKEFLQLKKEMCACNCPSCNVLVVKGTGCNHITCSNCQNDFCYICQKSYE